MDEEEMEKARQVVEIILHHLRGVYKERGLMGLWRALGMSWPQVEAEAMAMGDQWRQSIYALLCHVHKQQGLEGLLKEIGVTSPEERDEPR